MSLFLYSWFQKQVSIGLFLIVQCTLCVAQCAGQRRSWFDCRYVAIILFCKYQSVYTDRNNKEFCQGGLHSIFLDNSDTTKILFYQGIILQCENLPKAVKIKSWTHKINKLLYFVFIFFPFGCWVSAAKQLWIMESNFGIHHPRAMVDTHIQMHACIHN